jgi:hypothetical protein
MTLLRVRSTLLCGSFDFLAELDLARRVWVF